MRISELIRQLREVKKEYGDLPIYQMEDYGDTDLFIAVAYDADGRGPKDKGFKGYSKIILH